MEAVAWFGGLFMAAFGPVFLLLPIWGLARYPLRWLFGRALERRFGDRARWWLRGLASALVAGAAFLSWLPGRLALSDWCEQHAVPVVSKVPPVDGFFRERMFAYEAERYLAEWGFAWVEAPDPYTYDRPPRYLRYHRDDQGRVSASEIAAPSARYAVAIDHETRAGGLTTTLKRIVDRAGDQEIARAGSAVYHGGPLGLVLGVYGMAHCPDPAMFGPARSYFDDFYYLERKALRGR